MHSNGNKGNHKYTVYRIKYWNHLHNKHILLFNRSCDSSSLISELTLFRRLAIPVYRQAKRIGHFGGVPRNANSGLTNVHYEPQVGIFTGSVAANAPLTDYCVVSVRACSTKIKRNSSGTKYFKWKNLQSLINNIGKTKEERVHENYCIE